MTSPAALVDDSADATAPAGGKRWIFPAGLGILAALYLLQTLTPLRLDTDSVNYLIMATAMADAQPVPAIGLPTGYSVIVALMDPVRRCTIARTSATGRRRARRPSIRWSFWPAS